VCIKHNKFERFTKLPLGIVFCMEDQMIKVIMGIFAGLLVFGAIIVFVLVGGASYTAGAKPRPKEDVSS